MESFFENLLQLIRDMPPARRVTLIVVGVTSIAFLLGVGYWGSRPQYQLLYAGLEPDAASAVLEELRGAKVPYELGDGGRSVFVPSEQVYDLRLDLAGKGLPAGGKDGLELFDRSAMGATRFMQEVNYQRALQNELVRSITQIRGLRGARIHIVSPKESLFVEDREQARASVILNVDPNQRLKADQVKAIGHLVAGAIKGLEPQRVAIVDSNGNVLQNGEPDDASTAVLSADQMSQQFALEKELKGRIEGMLAPVVGPDNVVARVAAKLNFQRQESTSEVYDPDATAIRSQHRRNQANSRTAITSGGVAGVDANLPGRGDANDQQQQEGTSDSEETVNYEITKTVTRTVVPVGEIEHLSVAVLVDGTYKQVAGADGKKPATEYVPRTAEEVARFTALVKRAVGFDADRGDEVEVVSLPFANEEVVAAPELPGWQAVLPVILAAARYLPVAIFFVLFFLFFVRPLMEQVRVAQVQRQRELELAHERQQLALENGDSPAALTHTAGVVPRPANPQERMSKLIKEEPSQGVQVMRSWLREAEEGA
ncbi:MAG: flagellar basal-body MS-ring/collar protein FliF [Nitrospirota bacterium]|jgi:flagellar M-ring protein FliF